MLVLSEGHNFVVCRLVKGLEHAQEQQTCGHANKPSQDKGQCLVHVRLFVSDVRTVSNIFRCMVQVGVLAFDIGEGVMPDNMLMHPRVGGAKHEPDIHA